MKQTNLDEHITVDEIIQFVSFDKMDSASLANASKVATHIRTCDDCLQKVKAYQLVYDELSKLGHKHRFKEIAREKVKEKNHERDEVDV